MLLQEKMEKKTLPFWMAETEAEVTKLRTAAEGRPARSPALSNPLNSETEREGSSSLRPHQGLLATGKAADVGSYRRVSYLREQLQQVKLGPTGAQRSRSSITTTGVLIACSISPSFLVIALFKPIFSLHHSFSRSFSPFIFPLNRIRRSCWSCASCRTAPSASAFSSPSWAWCLQRLFRCNHFRAGAVCCTNGQRVLLCISLQAFL